MSITPTATSGETISAADENARNSEVSTKFNAHSHTDVDDLDTNTLTIGDNSVGNKTYAVDTDQANDPGIRYNTTNDFWTLSNDGSNYLAAAHAETTAGLSSGSMVFVGNSSGAIADAGVASNGQILIGRSGATPVLGSITGSNGITVSNGSGTINVAGIVAGTPALTLGTSNATGSASTYIATDATVAAFDATVPTTIAHGASAAAGSAGVAARRDHTHGAPASPAWEFVETLTTTSGTSVTSGTLPTDSDLFMVVFEEVGGTAAASVTMTGVENSISIQGTTVTATASSVIAEVDAENVNGVMYVPRLAGGSIRSIACNLAWYTALGVRSVTLLATDDTSAATITTMTFGIGAGEFDSGKIHIYKSIPS